ncbi:hypothetical protein CCP4SC76_6550006 [Gammaproteobacteria bacterium]
MMMKLQRNEGHSDATIYINYINIILQVSSFADLLACRSGGSLRSVRGSIPGRGKG